MRVKDLVGAEPQDVLVRGLVSVVIPSRDRAALLVDAIASCAAQIWRRVEIIVVDDGSDEDLGAAVSKARARHGLDERVRCVRQEPRGGAAARNLGLREARGEFVQFLDSDDVLHHEKLSLQVQRLMVRPHLDCALCLEELFDVTPGDRSVLWNVPTRADCPDDLDRFLIEDAPWSTGAPLWRRESLLRIGAWDETLTCWQDWQFHVQALGVGIRYEWVPRVLHYIREHNGPRSSRVRTLEAQRSCFRAGLAAMESLRGRNLLTARRQSLLLRYFERHLETVARIDDRGRARLVREMLSVMRPLARSPKRRVLLRILAAASGSRFLHRLVSLSRYRLEFGSPIVPMRATVSCAGLFERDGDSASDESLP